MKNSQPYHGEWWIPAEVHPDNNHGIYPMVHKGMEARYTGTLTYHENEDTILELYHVPSHFHSTQFAHNSVIWGRDANGHIFTLFNVWMREQRLGDFSKTTFVVSMILVGEHVISMDDAHFSKCIVSFPYLRNWAFRSKLRIQDESDNYHYTLTDIYKEGYLTEQSVDKGIEWKLRDWYTLNVTRYELNITQDTKFMIDAPEGISVRECLGQIGEFSQFLSIALYCEQNPSEVVFYTKDTNNKLELLFKKGESVAPPAVSLIKFDQLQSKIPSMLRAWHDNFDKVSPISGYLIDSLGKNSSFDVPDFLIIAQALDGYHKRFVNKKDGRDVRQYKDQMNALLKAFEEVDVIRDCKIDSEVLTDSRNKYSHLYPDDEESKAVKGGRLYRLTEKCKILLTCCLLNMMGLTSEEINICCNQSPIDALVNSLSFE